MTYLSRPTYLIPRTLLTAARLLNTPARQKSMLQSEWLSFISDTWVKRKQHFKYLLVGTQVYLLTRVTSVLIHAKFTSPGNSKVSWWTSARKSSLTSNQAISEGTHLCLKDGTWYWHLLSLQSFLHLAASEPRANLTKGHEHPVLCRQVAHQRKPIVVSHCTNGK